MRLWVVFSLLYFSATLTSTFTKELWFDELVSLYVDRLPGLPAVWSALGDSVDAMPPLFHVATRISHALISDEATAARLPGAIGYWTACLSIWLFLRRRMAPVHAWCGVAVMLLPGPFYYATEGRAYGLMLGFAGLTLLCWQRCTVPGRRPWHLAGLALFLCAAVSCHYYGVFLTIPLALAELYRMRNWVHGGWKRRDWPMLSAIGSVAVPLVLHQPLIRAADIYRSDTWAAPRWTDAIRVYADIFAGIGPALGAALIAAAVMTWWQPGGNEPDPREGLRRVDLVLATGLLLIPMAVLASSFLVTGTFFPRYAIPCILGVAITAAESLRRLCPVNRAVAGAFSGALLLALAAQRGLDISANWKQLPTAGEMSDVARLSDGPVVVEEAFDYIRAFYYSPPGLTQRLWYVPDARTAMEVTGLGNPDIGLEKLRSHTGFLLGTRQQFLDSAGTFFLVIDPVRPGWLFREMEKRQARVELTARLPRHWLMKVTR